MNISRYCWLASAICLLSIQTAKAGFEADAAAVSDKVLELKAQTPPIAMTDESMRITYIVLNACWQREASAQADALGLPEKICMDRVGIAAPADAPAIERPLLLVRGGSVSGDFRVAGSHANASGWSVSGEVFSSGKEARCGGLNMAMLVVSADMSAKGRILPVFPQVRGVLADGSLFCEHPAKAVIVPYTPLPD